MKYIISILAVLISACGHQPSEKSQSVEAPIEVQLKNIRQMIITANPALNDRETDLQLALEITREIHYRTNFAPMDMYIGGVTREENIRRILVGYPGWSHICAGISLSLMDALTSFGYQARIVQLFSNGPDGHAVVEVEIDGRWIGLDPSFNAVMVDGAGNLLSFKETYLRLHEQGIDPQWQYIGGSTKTTIEHDYYFTYKNLFYLVRMQPTGEWDTGAPLQIPDEGEERIGGPYL